MSNGRRRTEASPFLRACACCRAQICKAMQLRSYLRKPRNGLGFLRDRITPAPGKRKSIAAADLTDVFGIEFDESLAPEKVRTPAKSDHKGERFSAAHKPASRDALDQSHRARQTRRGAPREVRKTL